MPGRPHFVVCAAWQWAGALGRSILSTGARPLFSSVAECLGCQLASRQAHCEGDPAKWTMKVPGGGGAVLSVPDSVSLVLLFRL